MSGRWLATRKFYSPSREKESLCQKRYCSRQPTESYSTAPPPPTQHANTDQAFASVRFLLYVHQRSLHDESPEPYETGFVACLWLCPWDHVAFTLLRAIVRWISPHMKQIYRHTATIRKGKCVGEAGGRLPRGDKVPRMPARLHGATVQKKNLHSSHSPTSRATYQVLCPNQQTKKTKSSGTFVI